MAQICHADLLGFNSNRCREIVNAISSEPDLSTRKPVYDQLNDFSRTSNV
jgi:hypothetical protein